MFGEEENENESTGSVVARKQFDVRRRQVHLRHRRWRRSGLWLLRPAATSATRGGVCGARARSWVQLDQRLLLSGWTPMGLEEWILGSASVRWRPLGSTSLLRPPLLFGLLAPLTTES